MNIQNQYMVIPEHLRAGRTRDSGCRRRSTDSKEDAEFTSRKDDDGYRPSKDENRQRYAGL